MAVVLDSPLAEKQGYIMMQLLVTKVSLLYHCTVTTSLDYRHAVGWLVAQ